MNSSLNLKGEYMVEQINNNNKDALLILNLDKLHTTNLGQNELKEIYVQRQKMLSIGVDKEFQNPIVAQIGKVKIGISKQLILR